MTELADVQASDTCGYYFLVGSSPIVRTRRKRQFLTEDCRFLFYFLKKCKLNPKLWIRQIGVCRDKHILISIMVGQGLGLTCRFGRCFCFAEVSTGHPHLCSPVIYPFACGRARRPSPTGFSFLI